MAELERRLLARKHAVIVIAEGAGQKYVIKDPPEYDASGNVKLGDIGKFVKEKIEEYFKKRGLEIVIRYIDPSYIIRSVPANVEGPDLLRISGTICSACRNGPVKQAL